MSSLKQGLIERRGLAPPTSVRFKTWPNVATTTIISISNSTE